MKVKNRIIQTFFLAFVCGSVSINHSHAATGDELIITGNIVNLRTAPSTDAYSPIKLSKDRKVIEIQRQGDWVEIKTRRKDIKTGWVYKTLIAIVKKKESFAEKCYKAFQAKFAAYTEIIKKQNGAIYFSETRDKGAGTITLIATDAWLNSKIEERGALLNEVFNLWSEVVPVGSSMSVIVLDEQGAQHTVMLR
ncbi:MAG: hypothetical protein DHS20C09_04490 [marine bacterium B5-7]|nr:MAG: hypothetical protein DHS20C09_04490 [marine bacterium B5-7]